MLISNFVFELQKRYCRYRCSEIEIGELKIGEARSISQQKCNIVLSRAGATSPQLLFDPNERDSRIADSQIGIVDLAASLPHLLGVVVKNAVVLAVDDGAPAPAKLKGPIANRFFRAPASPMTAVAVNDFDDAQG